MLDCDRIVTSDFAHTVTWKGDPTLRSEPGTSVRLQFELRAAELFGFEWA